MAKEIGISCCWTRIYSLLTAMILFSLMPLSIVYVIVVTVHTWLIKSSANKGRLPITKDSKTVMLTGGKFSKSLHFARWFWKMGYKVVLIETEKYRWCGSQWSRAVTSFEIVTCPRVDAEKYVKDLIRVAEENHVNFFVPVSSPASALYDSRAKPFLESKGCRVLHFDECITKKLDNKHEFCGYAKSLGLDALATFCASSDDDVKEINNKLKEIDANDKDYKTYILKNIAYDPIHRLDMFKLPCDEEKLNKYLNKITEDGNPITPQDPWQVQQFVDGIEYTCMAVLNEGQIRAITTSESSASQLNYQHKDIPEITSWVEQFAAKTPQLTGQLCFDFIQEHHTQKTYPIECNPRIHSQCVVFLDKLEFGLAVLSENWEAGRTLVPDTSTVEMFWLYNELFKLLPRYFFPGYRKPTEKYNFPRTLRLIMSGRESDLDVIDPAPFILRNHLQLPMLLLDTFWNETPWVKLDFCIGKVVELGGD